MARETPLKSGDTIFYPAHGVAKVVGVEEREFGGISAEFFVLELSRGGRSMVPTKNVAQAGLRQLVTIKRAKELMKSLNIEPVIDNSRSWKDRASQYSEGLKTGTPESYTSILQELLYRARADKLSTTETKMLETARNYFMSEVGEVLNMTAEKLEKLLTAAITALLPEPPSPLEGDGGDEGDDEDGDDDESGDDDGSTGASKKKSAKKAGKKKAAKKSTSKAGSKKAASKKTASKKAGGKKKT